MLENSLLLLLSLGLFDLGLLSIGFLHLLITLLAIVPTRILALGHHALVAQAAIRDHVILDYLQNLLSCLGGLWLRKQSLQNTGLPSAGLNGTSHSLPQSLHVALCISRSSRSKPPRLLLWPKPPSFSKLIFSSHARLVYTFVRITRTPYC